MNNFLLFGKFMVEHGAWESYKRQYRASEWRSDTSPFKLHLQGRNPCVMLEWAFDFDESEEGDEYWFNLLDLFDEMYFETYGVWNEQS